MLCESNFITQHLRLTILLLGSRVDLHCLFKIKMHCLQTYSTSIEDPECGLISLVVIVKINWQTMSDGHGCNGGGGGGERVWMTVATTRHNENDESQLADRRRRGPGDRSRYR